MGFYRGKSLQGSNSSNAEDDLFMDALAARSKGLLPQTPQTDLEIPLVDDNGELFKSRPDWAFPSIRLLEFFDGPVHLHLKIERRDKVVTQLLIEKGWIVQRFPYDPPLSKRERKRILAEIIEAVKLASCPSLLSTIGISFVQNHGSVRLG